MKYLLTSKAACWGALILVIVCLIIQMKTPCQPWWTYSGIFAAFMMIFSHMAALYLYRMSPLASKKLDYVALFFGILTIIAIIAIYVAQSML